MSRWFIHIKEIRHYQGLDLSSDALQRARKRCWDVAQRGTVQVNPTTTPTLRTLPATSLLGKMRFNVYDGINLPVHVLKRHFDVGLSVGVVDFLLEEHVFSAYMSSLFMGTVLGAVLIFGGQHESPVDARRPYIRPRDVQRPGTQGKGQKGGSTKGP
jgi:hypothetical protein